MLRCGRIPSGCQQRSILVGGSRRSVVQLCRLTPKLAAELPKLRQLQLPPSDVVLKAAADSDRLWTGRRSILLFPFAGVAVQLIASGTAEAASDSAAASSSSSGTIPAAPGPAQASSTNPSAASNLKQPLPLSSAPSSQPPASSTPPSSGSSSSQQSKPPSAASPSGSASSLSSSAPSAQVPVPPPAVPLAEYPSPLGQPSPSPPPSALTQVPMNDMALSDEAARKLLKEEEARRKQRKGKGRLRELEEIRYELAEKEIALLRKETQLLEKDQTLLVLTEELELERKLRALLTKEKDRAEEEAALAMGLCTGGAMLP